jgi:S-adenosyl methyltransferase
MSVHTLTALASASSYSWRGQAPRTGRRSDRSQPPADRRCIWRVTAPGSILVVSHGTSDIGPERVAEAVRTRNQGGARIIARTGVQIRRFFEGLELVDPGLVRLPLWRPDGEVADDICDIRRYSGTARKD